MNSRVIKKTFQDKENIYLNLQKMTIEEAETIKTALAVLTEEKADRYGFNWNSNGTREKLLLFFIGITENMRGLANE